MPDPRRLRCLSLLLAAACTSTEAIPPDPADYDASCQVATDCRAVIDWAFDCGCSCGSMVALSAGAGADFQDDQDAFQEECDDGYCDLGCPALSPDNAVVDCVDNACAVVDGPYLSYY